MPNKDEEKRAFHTDEGVFCYTKMPFGLKNAGVTYQRLVDTIFEGQMGRNLEVYVDDMVIKIKTQPEMIKDVEETLLMLKKVNMKLNLKKCSFGMVEGKFLRYIITSEGIRANPKKAKAVVNMPSPSKLKQMQRLSGKLAFLNIFLSKAAERALPSLDTLRKCTNKKDFYWTTEAEKAFQAMKKLIAELPTLTAPNKEEELMVYLSAANEAISVVLLVEREGRKAPIHYVSRTLQGAVINYPPMEKLALALEATGRSAKWGIKLEAYGIKYAPRSVIKGQVLAGFLADTMAEDSPAQVKTKEPNKILVEGESMKEQEVMETKAPENLRIEEDIWKLYTDGASNEHGSGAGLILIDPKGAEYPYALRLNFANSNNDAEYEALLTGLRIETKMKVKKMHAFIDLKLVASQVEGSYEAKEENPTERYHRSMNNSREGPQLHHRGRSPISKVIPGTIAPMHRFKIPATIITDNETQLINDPFKSWAEGLGIKLVFTSVYHPQANGAVERANRSIMQGIKTRLHQEGGAWVEELPNVLWAHRTTLKMSNGETPFSLVYGTEAVIPAKIGIPKRRTIQGSDKENEEAFRMNLNLLEERREIATIREARRKQQVEKY
ncbi:reverse transcriptase domain-containing protein [Tanacetum coccineum]